MTTSLSLEEEKEILKREIAEKEKIILDLSLREINVRIIFLYLHDIKNSLSYIAGQLSNLFYVLDHSVIPVNQSKEIIRSFDHLQEEYSNLLDIVSYMRAGAICINKYIENFVNSPIFNSGKMKLMVELDPRGNNFIIDSQYLGPIFENIIINAYEASVDMRKVLVLLINSYVENNQAVVTFTDNGCGISEEYLNKIWIAGFTTKPKALGLGLFVVKKLLEKLGGEITISSNLGSGTKVKVIIPGQLVKKP